MNREYKITHHLYPILIILGIWITSFAWVNPLHEFPLNDDWSYSYTVKKMVEEGHYELTNWVGNPQVTQTLFGALFCLPFGFSFTALKLSTLVVGIIGLLVLYFFVWKMIKNRLAATLACLTMGLNPIFFSLSATFMTDVHFFTWFILSIYSFVIFENEHKSIYLIAGTIFSILAILTRQFGIVAPAAMLVYKLINARKILNISVLKYLGATIIVYGFYMSYIFWLHSNNLFPNLRGANEIFNTNPDAFFFRVFIRTGITIHDLGLWLLPISVPLLISERKPVIKHIKSISIILFIFLIPMVRVLSKLPSGNIFNYEYIGVLTTYDTYILKQIPDIWQSNYIGTVFIILSFIGGVLLVVLFSLNTIRVIKSIKANHNIWNPQEAVLLIALVALILYLGIVMISFTCFDRYMIPLAFLTLIILLSNNYKPIRFSSITILLLVFMAFISLTQTKNYLAWTNCRSELIQNALNNKIEPNLIDGGHEFNGWNGDKIDDNGQWEVSQKKYAITFTPIEGFEVIQTAQFKVVLNSIPQNMYLLKKLQSQ